MQATLSPTKKKDVEEIVFMDGFPEKLIANSTDKHFEDVSKYCDKVIDVLLLRRMKQVKGLFFSKRL